MSCTCNHAPSLPVHEYPAPVCFPRVIACAAAVASLRDVGSRAMVRVGSRDTGTPNAFQLCFAKQI